LNYISNATENPVADLGGGSPDDRTDDGSGESNLSPEDTYEVLSNARRRHIIHYLLQQEGGISLRELSRQVAACENDIEPAAVTSKQRKRVYTALHQSHLPKLDDTGIVEYDSDRSMVSPTERVSDLRLYHGAVPEDEIPWSVYYTCIGLVCGGSALLSWAGVVPFSLVGGYAWAGLIALPVILTGAIHIWTVRRHEPGSEGLPPELRN
jgi:hypothetical protein